MQDLFWLGADSTVNLHRARWRPGPLEAGWISLQRLRPDPMSPDQGCPDSKPEESNVFGGNFIYIPATSLILFYLEECLLVKLTYQSRVMTGLVTPRSSYSII